MGKYLVLKGSSTNKKAKAFMVERAYKIMLRSKQEFCPVDKGTLRKTGHVRLPQETANTLEVTMGYGGPAARYAALVHENPRAGKTGGLSPSGRRYKTWAKVGQWKYLEQPFNEETATFVQELTAVIKSNF